MKEITEASASVRMLLATAVARIVDGSIFRFKNLVCFSFSIGLRFTHVCLNFSLWPHFDHKLLLMFLIERIRPERKERF